jgi:methyltransferase (TIGR00027 family)
MRHNQSSTTAENNAAIRAFESMRPLGQRVCDDPFARHFISDALLQAPNLRAALGERMTAWQRFFPGVCDAIVARTRFIDDCLKIDIEAGLRQLVILGAGYDTRALRFDCQAAGITVFELDHPATQAKKLARYRRRLQTIPEHVVFIPVDFNAAQPDRALCEAGFDCAKTSFFIWEGMSYYFSPPAVRKTLSFVADVAAAGTALIFDYVPPAVISGTIPLTEAIRLTAALKQLGEEFLFGLDPDQAGSFLHRHGFQLITNQSAQASNSLYFKAAPGDRGMSRMFFFALARVKAAPLGS